MSNIEQEIGLWDSVLLEHLTEDSFVANLHHRYKHDLIYTNIGTFLVAINPYKPLSIFGPEQVQCYATKNIFKLPPHIYGVTSLAYQWLQDHNENQCIIVSGESCSGKTETSRLIVHFLSQVSEARLSKRKCDKDKSTKTLFGKNANHNSHSDISTTKCVSGSNLFRNPSGRAGLLKQCSIETAKSTLKKCSHEKTVDFDFLHYKSTENLSSTPGKCQKHAASHNTEKPPANSPKQCNKHGQSEQNPFSIQQAIKGSMIDSCLKKPICDSSNKFLSNKSGEAIHLPVCSKTIQTINQKTTPQHTGFDQTMVSNQKPQCDRCGHTKCAKSIETQCSKNNNLASSYPSNSLKSLTRSDSNCSKCNCDHAVVKQIRTPIMIKKKILKNPSGESVVSSSSGPTSRASSSQSLYDSIELEQFKIRERIAQAEVFLEAIGHATTIKNYNSSRYGKYFDIKFDFKGDPIGAHITHYKSNDKNTWRTKFSYILSITIWS